MTSCKPVSCSRRTLHLGVNKTTNSSRHVTSNITVPLNHSILYTPNYGVFMPRRTWVPKYLSYHSFHSYVKTRYAAAMYITAYSCLCWQNSSSKTDRPVQEISSLSNLQFMSTNAYKNNYATVLAFRHYIKKKFSDKPPAATFRTE